MQPKINNDISTTIKVLGVFIPPIIEYAPNNNYNETILHELYLIPLQTMH